VTKARPDKKTLERLYTKEGLSIREIASKLECSKDLIHTALKEYGITTRARIRPSRLYEYGLQDLQGKVRTHGIRGTARLVGVSEATLRYHLKRRTGGERVNKK
jgi:transposase